MRYFIYTIIGIVVAAVIAGFFIIGSPKEERARRFDAERVQNLQFIQAQIGEFYRAKGRLPENLNELNDAFRGIVIPQDPEHRVLYSYEVRGELTFALCTTFNRPALSQERGVPKQLAPMSFEGPFGTETWEHEAGPVCFERTIDRDFFLPSKIQR